VRVKERRVLVTGSFWGNTIGTGVEDVVGKFEILGTMKSMTLRMRSRGRNGFVEYSAIFGFDVWQQI
jgi:hypothetical protein